jgi:hypothetical protein
LQDSKILTLPNATLNALDRLQLDICKKVLKIVIETVDLVDQSLKLLIVNCPITFPEIGACR